jgi:TatD DNase family protein
MIIHCVKAFNELIRIKKENKVSVPMIIHGFNNNEQIAEQLLKENFYLSFGKAILINNSNAQKVFKNTGIEKLFLETDDSDVSIKSIFDKAAELKGMSVEELKEKIYLNFKTIFDHE